MTESMLWIGIGSKIAADPVIQPPPAEIGSNLGLIVGAVILVLIVLGAILAHARRTK